MSSTTVEGGGANKKRRLSPTTPDISPILSPAFIHAASQAAAGFPATQGALVTGGLIPTVDQVKVAAKKMVQEVPPMVHLSKTDSAPQLKIENDLTVQGGMRGYRTTRATHGVNAGDYYFECWIQEGPSVEEIKTLLPPNVRLAPKLKKQLQQASDSTTTKQTVGGHARIGWSLRLGDLQAPVGYDKFSYAYRDISGSRVHNSLRQDDWGAESYGPGDVVGFAIFSELGQIHFYKNGKAMGQSVVSRGKREGGAAFEDIPEGTYYPAISVFLGGTVRANFGPHFVYHPRKLPHGVKVKPMSDLVVAAPDDDIAARVKTSLPKKTDDSLQKALQEALETEAGIRKETADQHYQQHVRDVKKEREARNLSVNDLLEGSEAAAQEEASGAAEGDKQ